MEISSLGVLYVTSGHLSKIILNTWISGVKSCWNTLYYARCACAAAFEQFETAVFLFLIWPRNAAREGGSLGDQVHRRWSWRNLENVSFAKSDKALLVKLNMPPLSLSLSMGQYSPKRDVQ